jgi:NADPH-dependent 2,4-dienoyl-CoA reductase/sulfur reductase-like enzyme
MTHATVIVGASVGGVRTAQALRRVGYTGHITVVGEESVLPYDKPPLSKAMLLDESPDLGGVPLLTQKQAEGDDIHLELGVRAAALDLAGHQVVLADDRRLVFDDVVVATGAAARPSPWGTPTGVHVLRTVDDAHRLRAELEPGQRMVVVGAGFIGAEVASAAQRRGLDVHVVDPLPVPMGRVVGDDLGLAFVDLHHRHGVQTSFGTGVEGIEEQAGQLRVLLTDGTCLDADTVVVGIGTALNDDWLETSGLLLDNGVVCDQYSRAVNEPHVHTVGDIARWHHPRHGEPVRVEHWTNAIEQAACVAHNIAHPDDLRSFEPVEYVWTDQYDWKVQIAGCPWRATSSILLGDPRADTRFAALYATSHGQLCGAVSVNWPKVTVRSRRAVAAGESLDDVHAALASARAAVR